MQFCFISIFQVAKAELFNWNVNNDKDCSHWIGTMKQSWRSCEKTNFNYDLTKVRKCSFTENKYFDDNRGRYIFKTSNKKCRDVTNTFEDPHNGPQINIEISPELIN